METPQKRQKSWFSSLTGLVSGSRTPSQQTSATEGTQKGSQNTDNKNNSQSGPPNTNSGLASSTRLRSTRTNNIGTSSSHHYSGTFSAPPVESPESPAKRASPSLLAQRKIHERVHGPSSRLGASSSHGASGFSDYVRPASTPRRTNFSSATTPRNMFRNSTPRDLPAFTFTPRVPSSTMRGNFPTTTPGRSYRAPGVELSGRELAKVSSKDLFAMKIPDPDPKLSGEAIANMVPKDAKHDTRSVYANEYLSHLCPPDFNEEQRNQFFCILDLRRLKYAADEVFLKKDWRLNILNFAKEYEKNRSLIMLRYGLYEFKTVKVSKEVFQKWKTSNNIPDLEEEEDDAPEGTTSAAAAAPPSKTFSGLSSTRIADTEGILRTGKRKAQDNIDPANAFANASSAAASKKRRPAESARSDRLTEREPLAEAATPTLNKSKRKASTDSVDPRSKLHKSSTTSSATPSATPSATKAFLERIANSPAKDASSSGTPAIQVSKPAESSPLAAAAAAASSSSSFTPLKATAPAASAAKPSNGSNSLARSVLESGLKGNALQSNNIFGYLSDASSAKGSGNDNADADGEDTDSDDQEESEPQTASDTTPKTGAAPAAPASSLFAAKPLAPASAASPFGITNGSGNSSEASDSGTGRSLFDRINKGTDGQPIRLFGSSEETTALPAPSSSDAAAVPATTTAANAEKPVSLFPSDKTWNPSTPIKFGGASASSAPLFGAMKPATTGVSASASASASALFGATAPASKTESKETAPAQPSTTVNGISNNAAGASSQTTSAPSSTPASNDKPLFGFPTSKPSESGATTTPSLFGQPSKEATPKISASSLFGKQGPQQTNGTSATPTTTDEPKTSALQPHSLFGSTLNQGTKQQASDEKSEKKQPEAPATSQPATGLSLFGTTTNKDTSSSSGEPAAKRTLFGNSSEPPAKKALFGSAPSTSAPATTTGASSTPIFSFGAPKEDVATKPAAGSDLFGSQSKTPAVSQPATTQTKSLFGSTSASTAAPATPAAPPPTSIFSFGATPASKPADNNNAAGNPATSAAPLFGASTAGSGAGSGFTFSVGNTAGQSFHNPFATSGAASAAPPTTINFGASAQNGTVGTSSSSLFQFGGAANSSSQAPQTGSPSVFAFGAGSTSTAAPTNGIAAPAPSGLFGNGGGAQSTPSSNGPGAGSIFSFGAGTPAASNGMPTFGAGNSATGAPIFGLNPTLGGASTGY